MKTLRRRYGHAADRLADLMRQGFMKPTKRKKLKEEKPVVACEACLNWHREGKHTATAVERRVNLAAMKASAR